MLDKKGISRFFAALGLAAALLLITTPVHASFILQYELTYFGTRTEVSANPRSLYINDTFDSYSSLDWWIVSAEDDGQGGVYVFFDWEAGEIRNDADIFDAHGTIRIVPVNGSNYVTPVIVDVWAVGEIYDEIVSTGLGGEEEIVGTAEVSLNVQSLGWFSPGLNHFGSYELLTNTDYAFDYVKFIFVETNPFDLHFSSWGDFGHFLTTFGSSGTNSFGITGFFNFGLELRSHTVPEPRTLVLLGFSLAGLGFSRRRRQ